MAKFRVSPELVKALLPVVLPIVKELAAKTTTTVDDSLVEALEKVVNNPLLFALLLSLLEGQTPAPANSADEAAIAENADLLRGVFSVAVAPDGETV